MFKGRTAAYFDNTIVGHHEHLKQLFEASVKVVNLPLIVDSFSRFIQFENNSDIDFELVKAHEGIKLQKSLHLKSHKISLESMKLFDDSFIQENSLKVEYEVKNLKSISGEPVIVGFEFLKIELVREIKI